MVLSQCLCEMLNSENLGKYFNMVKSDKVTLENTGLKEISKAEQVELYLVSGTHGTEKPQAVNEPDPDSLNEIKILIRIKQ